MDYRQDSPLNSLNNLNFIQNIKCQIHKDKNTIAICLKPQCKLQSRLLCTKCLIGCHRDHSPQTILFEELPKNNQNQSFKTQNWPQDETALKCKESLQTQIIFSTKEQICQIFKQIEDSVLENLQNVQKQVVIAFQSRQQQVNEKVKDLKSSLENSFSLNNLESILEEFSSEENKDYQNLNQNVEKFLNFTQDQKKRENLDQKLNQFRRLSSLNNINFNQFVQKETEKINQLIQQLGQTLSKESNSILPFYKSLYEDSQEQISIDNNKINFKNGGYSRQCFTDILQFNSIYKFQMKLTGEVVNRCYGIGLIIDGKENNSLGFPDHNGVAICLHCQNSQGNFEANASHESFGLLLQQHQQQGNVINEIQIDGFSSDSEIEELQQNMQQNFNNLEEQDSQFNLIVEIDLSSNLFKIESSKKNYQKQLKNFDFKSKSDKWRFFIFRYSQQTTFEII